MKTKNNNIRYILVLVLVCAGLFACQDFLTEDPKGQMATPNFFKSEQDIDAALTALHKVIKDQNDANNVVGTEALAGDDISTHPASNKINLREYDKFDVSENNAWMPRFWKARYQTIKAANFVICNVPNCENASQEKINTALGIASFWRAQSLFYLVTTWGEVPMILTEEVDMDVGLSSVEEIYAQIVKDLEVAEKYCPALYTKAPYVMNGKNIAPSEVAAKAALSYVYMCMAGWPLNKTEYYDKAAAKAKEVIDGVNSGKYYHKLLPEFWMVHSEKYNLNNPETIVGIYYSDLSGHNSQSPVCDFLADFAQGGWGDTNGEIKFWKDFPDGPRKDATYFPKIMLSDKVLRDWWEEPFGKRDVVAPCFMKTAEYKDGREFDYTDPAGFSAYGNKHHQVIRLSEVYCWYAEAVGRSGKINQAAVDALNKVRNRADGAQSNIYSMSMTPEELAEAAYNEHGWEVAGYYWSGFATRARDMFRMYRYKDHFEFRKQNPPIEVAPGVFRKEAVPVEGTWSDKRMYAPRPYQFNIEYNPNLAN